MAKVELNEAIGSLRGKIDGWVYRRQNGQTIVGRYRTPKAKGQSAAQKQTRVRFQAAQAYATEVMADPLRRLVYQKLGADRKRPPNTLLIANFLTPPTIEVIDASGYKGRADDLVQVVALDPIEVTQVLIRIRIQGGVILETGSAQSEHGVWSYRATVTAPANAPLAIEVTARNRAGAEATATTAR